MVMAALSRKLRSVAFDMSVNKVGIAFFCPGCDESHAIPTRGGGASWQWDGDVNAPTVTPSINVTSHNAGVQSTCHSFIEAGNIRFLGDCTHALRGQTVPLPDWPNDHDEAAFYLEHPRDKVVF